MVKWDLAETAKGGPFSEILEQEIFVNCIYLNKPIPPFISKPMLVNEARVLEVVVDVSCDITNPHNPIPIYSTATTFDCAVEEVTVEAGKFEREKYRA